MTTPRISSVVSLVAALGITFTLGACVSANPRVASDVSASADPRPQTIRFDNTGREFVHVYLVGAKREWLLGRVEPGARASLRVPEEAMTDDAGSMQLAVLVGARVTLGAVRASRMAITIAQPGAALLDQRWTYSQTSATGQLTSLPVRN
ncbi:hypothetical protein BH09GEM1_BH09GEM1_32310 [soil metagenome]